MKLLEIATKALAALSAPFLLALPATANAAETCKGVPGAGMAKLVVEATDVRSAAGEVQFTVYANDRARFLAKGGKLARVRVAAMQPVTRGCFWLPAGIYAIAQYHDENDDHQFNRTLFVPKEGFGFSNDAPTSLGLPSLQATRFTLVPGGTLVRMKMRYHR